jgi:hypothetical protein
MSRAYVFVPMSGHYDIVGLTYYIAGWKESRWVSELDKSGAQVGLGCPELDIFNICLVGDHLSRKQEIEIHIKSVSMINHRKQGTGTFC